MAIRMTGAQVNEAICSRIRAGVARLAEQNVTPKAAIVRVGERPSDLSYERGFTKRAEGLGVAVQKFVLPETASVEELIDTLETVNCDDSIHGCLLFRPLPRHLNIPAVTETLSVRKDVDAMTSGAMGALITRDALAFPPCTAMACLEVLDHYGVSVKGKNVVIIGRGMAVGMPVSILLINRHATVSVCNSLTEPEQMKQLCRSADIIIAATGKAGLVTADMVRPGQTILDVGINQGPNGKLCGDVAFDEVEPIVAAITPVPGGVGAVTSTVLASHTVEAALRACGLK